MASTRRFFSRLLLSICAYGRSSTSGVGTHGETCVTAQAGAQRVLGVDIDDVTDSRGTARATASRCAASWPPAGYGASAEPSVAAHGAAGASAWTTEREVPILTASCMMVTGSRIAPPLR